MEDNKISPYTDYDPEQFLLSEGIEIDEPAKMYLNEIKRVPPLTPETEKQFLQNLDDKKTRTKLTHSYLRFVIAIAVEYISNGMELMDLIHSGNSGLIKAAESFNGNISFAEYAENYIRSEINSEIERNKNDVRIPIFTMNTIESSADGNRNITVKKIADVLQRTEFDARQIDVIYRYCKQRKINIVSSISPYINYDVEEILSVDGVEIGGTLKEYFTQIKQTVPLLTPEEEKQLLQDIDRTYNKKRLAEGYLRSVVMVAREYIYSDNGLLNLTAFGNDGLRKAVESLCCTENVSFPILAEWLVRQEILKEIKRNQKYMKFSSLYKRKKVISSGYTA